MTTNNVQRQFFALGLHQIVLYIEMVAFAIVCYYRFCPSGMACCGKIFDDNEVEAALHEQGLLLFWLCWIMILVLVFQVTRRICRFIKERGPDNSRYERPEQYESRDWYRINGLMVIIFAFFMMKQTTDDESCIVTTEYDWVSWIPFVDSPTNDDKIDVSARFNFFFTVMFWLSLLKYIISIACEVI